MQAEVLYGNIDSNQKLAHKQIAVINKQTMKMFDIDWVDMKAKM